MTALRPVLALAVAVLLPDPVVAAPVTRTLGQPSLGDTTLASRCPDADARFNFANDGGFEMYGPAGIAVDPRGPIWVADFGGRRVLGWPDATALTACAPAAVVLGAGEFAGPESVAVDPRSGSVFVADTLSHTVRGYRSVGGVWTKTVTLGAEGQTGTGFDRFNFPRGIAFDPNGRLFVADDFNKRVLIFDPPFSDGEAAADSIGAGANGGFSSPKALAMTGDTLFVADYFNDRVLRFTGPFRTPDKVYVATAVFSGVKQPVDLATAPDGSLLVTAQGDQAVARFADATFRPSTATPTSSFTDGIGPEPLGVAADREGRVFVADYRRFRVLIREERVRRGLVTSGGTMKAKALLANLHARATRTTDRVLIGQQLLSWEYGPKDEADGWYGDWLQMRKAGLPLPEIMGAETSDLMSYPGFAPNKDALAELIRHGKSGRPVTLVWHPSNPVPRGSFGKPTPTANLRAMIDDGTTIGRRWQVQLDRAAAVLKRFSDAGVPVLFRPLHEQNGDFFWWGDPQTSGAARSARQAAWIAVWRDMVTELTVRKGLKNIVFVFGANQVNWSGVAPVLTYYPGARWADVVSIDIYDEQLDMAGPSRGLSHYAAMVGTGKPVGISEFGQSFGRNGTGATGKDWDARTLTRRLKDSYPRAVFAVAWYSSVEGDPPVEYRFALPDVKNTRAMLADPIIDTQ